MKFVTLKYNLPLLHDFFLISYLLISVGANKEKNYKYMGMQSWR